MIEPLYERVHRIMFAFDFRDDRRERITELARETRIMESRLAAAEKVVVAARERCRNANLDALIALRKAIKEYDAQQEAKP